MIPFSPPRIDQKTIDAVVDVLKSGWITTGPKVKEFEQKLTEYCGNKETLCVNSATAGLELVLRWFGVSEGDEVIIPAYTYCATANVVEHCGAKAIMVDVNSTDFNINVESVRKAITNKTKVIIPVDFGGMPCDYLELYEVINDLYVKSLFNPNSIEQEKLGRVLILSDSAHSFGAQYLNQKAGTFADISVFSFHAVKNLTTAEGGAIAFNLPDQFNNTEVYSLLRTWSLHGQNKDALTKTKAGAWEYDVVIAGYKCNMTDIHAAIGVVELERYDSENLSYRKHIVNKYTEALRSYEWAELPVFDTNNKTSSYHLFPLRIKGVSISERNRIIDEVSNAGVSVNVHFKPLPLLKYYKEKGYDINQFPISLDGYSREISLPVYYGLTDKQIDIVIQSIISSVNKAINIA